MAEATNSTAAVVITYDIISNTAAAIITYDIIGNTAAVIVTYDAISSTGAIIMSDGRVTDGPYPAYMYGGGYGISIIIGYLAGGTETTNSTSVFLAANIGTSSDAHAYIVPTTETIIDYRHSYCSGILKSSTPACISGGTLMTAVDYIWLKTSDNGATLSKKFRVIAQDYDDGTKEKAESIERTIGGGVDHSMGSVYTTWSPIIRVRATESEADYGSKNDLEYFYDLVNPNATPSNEIIFVDHHQIEYRIHLVGKMTKNLMGSEIEGTEAWYLYKLNFLRVR